MAQVAAPDAGWILLVSNAATAAVAGFFAWLAARAPKKSKAEDELSAIQGFQLLAEQQREEMDRLVERVEAADLLIGQLRHEAHDIRNRFMRLLSYVQTAMFAYVHELHEMIRAGGKEPPPMPPLPDLSPAKKPTT